LDKAAKALFIDFYNRCGEEAFAAEQREAAAWAKLSGYAARLVLCGQLTRNPRSEVIAGDTMEEACKLSQWFGREATRIYAALSETPAQREARELIEFIQRRGGAVTIRDAMQNYRALRNDRKKAEQQFNATVKAGLASWEPIPTTPKGGKPTRQIRLISETSGASGLRNPMLHEGKTGFVDVDSKDK
jgi:hypothetical protein